LKIYRLFEHAVNLFKGETLGFEVSIDESTRAETQMKKKVGFEVALALTNHERRDDGAAVMVFQNQLEAVDRATLRERSEKGKISPVTTHAPGPRTPS
jgi:hypothetical protein